MKAKIDYDLVAKRGAIMFFDLDAQEFDSLRILLKSVFEYGQFADAKEISKDLGMQKMIKAIAVEQQKNESQQIIISHVLPEQTLPSSGPAGPSTL